MAAAFVMVAQQVAPQPGPGATLSVDFDVYYGGPGTPEQGLKSRVQVFFPYGESANAMRTRLSSAVIADAQANGLSLVANDLTIPAFTKG